MGKNNRTIFAIYKTYANINIVTLCRFAATLVFCIFYLLYEIEKGY